MRCWWWRTCRSLTCCAVPSPCPIQTSQGIFCQTASGRSPDLTEVLVTPAGADSSRFCAPKRKRLGASGLRSIPGILPTAVKSVNTQQRITASCKRNLVAPHADTPHRLTSMPRVTSCGLDWPFTRQPREKKLMASSHERSHLLVVLGWVDPSPGKLQIALTWRRRFLRCGVLFITEL